MRALRIRRTRIRIRSQGTSGARGGINEGIQAVSRTIARGMHAEVYRRIVDFGLLCESRPTAGTQKRMRRLQQSRRFPPIVDGSGGACESICNPAKIDGRFVDYIQCQNPVILLPAECMPSSSSAIPATWASASWSMPRNVFMH